MEKGQKYNNYFRHASVYYDRLTKDMKNLVNQCNLWEEKWRKSEEENTTLRGEIRTLSKTKEDLRTEYEFIDKIIKKYEINSAVNT